LITAAETGTLGFYLKYFDFLSICYSLIAKMISASAKQALFLPFNQQNVIH